jgi:hypothetical protein
MHRADVSLLSSGTFPASFPVDINAVGIIEDLPAKVRVQIERVRISASRVAQIEQFHPKAGVITLSTTSTVKLRVSRRVARENTIDRLEIRGVRQFRCVNPCSSTESRQQSLAPVCRSQIGARDSQHSRSRPPIHSGRSFGHVFRRRDHQCVLTTCDVARAAQTIGSSRRIWRDASTTLYQGSTGSCLSLGVSSMT